MALKANRLKTALAALSSCLMLTAGSAYSEELSPNFFYYYDGKLIGDWFFQVGDPSNWSTNVDGLTGRSADGKLEVAPDNYKGEGDAIRGDWSRKKVRGVLSIVASPKDISNARDIAALTFDLKLNKKPKKDILVGISCGWPCHAELSVGRQLRDKKQGEWFIFPIPLNCFKGDDFDLSKVNGFSIATDGKADISVANIRLERLPPGEKGCAE